MKIKTNLRAGSGGSATDTSTSSSANSGGVNAGGVNGGGGKTTNTVVSIVPAIGRCVGI
jgi:hypothetical protein